MPVTTKGRRVVCKRTGKTKFTAKSAAHAKRVAAARNIAYARKRGHKILRKK